VKNLTTFRSEGIESRCGSPSEASCSGRWSITPAGVAVLRKPTLDGSDPWLSEARFRPRSFSQAAKRWLYRAARIGPDRVVGVLRDAMERGGRQLTVALRIVYAAPTIEAAVDTLATFELDHGHRFAGIVNIVT
jgi:hypothetical protein